MYNGSFHTIFGKLLVVLMLFSEVPTLSIQQYTTLARPLSQSENPMEVLEGDRNYFVKVDLQDPRVHAKVLLANNDQGGLEPLYNIKNRLNGKYSQWAIVNGDLFSSGCPDKVNCAQGLTYIDGQRKENWSVYGTTWPARGNIGFSVTNNVNIAVGDAQTNRYTSIAGGPWIVQNGGTPTCSAEYQSHRDKTRFSTGEEFDENVTSWCSDNRAITLIGYSENRRYLYMGISQGWKNVNSVAQWLKERGAHEVLRLDSGGSSKMYFNNNYIGGNGSEPGRPIANAFAIVVDNGAPPPRECSAPNLTTPNNGMTTTQRAITFRWESVPCSQNKYVLRIKTISNMETGGEQVENINLTGTERSVTINDPRWHNRDLYWSVIPEVSGGQWAPARLFRINPNDPPHVSFDRANNQGITSNDQQVWGNTRDWTFSGTASDSDGVVDRVDVLCSGDSCNDGPRANGTTNWSNTRSGLEGLQTITVYAYDNKSARSPESDRYRIKLGIDLAAPTTLANLNDRADATQWPEYFNTPVQVRLTAGDNGTRSAFSGIRELRYRLDGQQGAASASSTTFSVEGDGSHTVTYYAIDNAGNQEAERSISFKIDRTPPTAMTAVAEVHAIASGQWQRDHALPTFTWTASNDTLSGIATYELALEERGGVGERIEQRIAADRPRQWTPPKPDGLRTGSYLLRGRVGDKAGNWSAWADLFIFRYDKTPPANPVDVRHTAAITSEVWQRTTRLADFSWPVPHDEGSGIKGYYVAWGSDQNATSATLITSNRFQSNTPICAADAACTGYLRLRSVDNVDNQAEGWTTAFVLRYDNAPPTAAFSFAEGSSTSQTAITLQIASSDQGSGVKAMRFSHDGKHWSEWEAYASERPWRLPAISRQSWPVYMQVRDGVDLVSPAVSHTIYLDVNPQQPRSAGYRLFDRALSAGSTTHSSPHYRAHSTVGQVLDSARLSSGHYTLVGGYEASSQALPLTIPGYDKYRLITGIFASSTGAKLAQSSQYRLSSSLGEAALPNNQTELTSPNYQHQPGFLAGAYSGPTLPPIVIETALAPEPPFACTIPSVNINGGALFTTHSTVRLALCAPQATEVMLSNDKAFGGAQWEPYATTKSWNLDATGQGNLPRYVYAAFRDADGNVHSAYFDEIIYDPNAPSGSIAVEGVASSSMPQLLAGQIDTATLVGPQPLVALATQQGGNITLRLDGIDDNSGIKEVAISSGGEGGRLAWEPYVAVKQWTPTGEDGEKTVSVRLRDSAGNISSAIDARFLLDTQPPLGGIAVEQRVIGPATITTTVYLGAQDATSSVADMRVSTDPTFTDAVWQPYTTELLWPLGAVGGSQRTFYVQYRDQVGNVSGTYSDTVQIDTTPPVVYAEASVDDTLARNLSILAYDEFSDLAEMRLSNDPLLIDAVVTSAYQPTANWTFDTRRVVWVQVQDRVGNWSEPYPIYAAPTLSNGPVYLPIIRRDN